MKTCSLGTIVLLCCFVTLGVILFSACVQNRPDTSGGEKIYSAQCAPCHGPDGSGFRALYPPLRSSDYLDSNIGELACLIRFGLTGTLVTGDGSYNQRMPAFPLLTTSEMIELIAYLQVRWGDPDNLTSPESIEKWLATCP